MARFSIRSAPLLLPRQRAADAADMPTRWLALLVLASLAAGIGSAWLTLGERPPFGAVRIGPWESFPRLGSSDVDPYGRAILARGPHLPLARGEGLDLTAGSDSAGEPLRGGCRYRIGGASLPARGWTLTVQGADGRQLPVPAAAALTDADLVTDESGLVRIMAAPTVMAGNWLKLPPEGRFSLRLRVYDTPVSSGIGQLASPSLPAIERLSCGG